MSLLKHWCETYPHYIWVSVLLKDNKIIDLKVGQHRIIQRYDMNNLIRHYPDYSYAENKYVVYSSEDHNRIFEKDAKQWMKQWGIHKDFDGCLPFECEINKSCANCDNDDSPFCFYCVDHSNWKEIEDVQMAETTADEK